MTDEDKKVEEVAKETKKGEKKETPTEKTPTEKETKVEETPVEETDTKKTSEPETEAEEPKEEKKNPTEAWIEKIEGAKEIKPGMTVRVHERITDTNSKGETKERLQVFEGIILYLRNAGISRTMTVRKVSKGFGVEKIYPINSPVVAKIEVIKIAKVRRANLRYLGNLKRRFKRKLKETRLERKKK